MTLAKFILLGIFLLISFHKTFALEVYLPKSALTTEKKTLEFLIDNYFSQYDKDKRYGRREARRKIKQWNPHIKSWKNINDRTNIYVYKKRFNLDLSLGQEFNSFSNDFINHDSTTLSLYTKIEYNHFYWQSLAFHLNIKRFSYYENEAQSDTAVNCFTVGATYKFIVKRSPSFSILSILERDQFAHYALINKDRTVIHPLLIVNNLLASTTTINYIGIGLEHKGQLPELLPNKSYIKVFRSISGTIQSNATEDSEDTTATKVELGFSQFILKNVWGKLTYQRTMMSADANEDLNYSNYALNLGATF